MQIGTDGLVSESLLTASEFCLLLRVIFGQEPNLCRSFGGVGVEGVMDLSWGHPWQVGAGGFWVKVGIGGLGGGVVEGGPRHLGTGTVLVKDGIVVLLGGGSCPRWVGAGGFWVKVCIGGLGCVCSDGSFAKDGPGWIRAGTILVRVGIMVLLGGVGPGTVLVRVDSSNTSAGQFYAESDPEGDSALGVRLSIKLHTVGRGCGIIPGHGRVGLADAMVGDVLVFTASITQRNKFAFCSGKSYFISQGCSLKTQA